MDRLGGGGGGGSERVPLLGRGVSLFMTLYCYFHVCSLDFNFLSLGFLK